MLVRKTGWALFFADLVSSTNRPTDLKRNENVSSTPVVLPDGSTENQYIENLFEVDSRYQDDVTYELFPSSWSNDYNSNSYTSGLLNATGGRVNQPPHDAPGFRKPLPSRKFK